MGDSVIKKSGGKSRYSNLELYRIIVMLLIVAHIMWLIPVFWSQCMKLHLLLIQHFYFCLVCGEKLESIALYSLPDTLCARAISRLGSS